MRRRLPLLALVLGALFSWAALRADRPLAPSPGGPPARVVLFAPNLTETACALGYAGRIVGITDYCRWPPEILDRPRVGGAIDPHLERLLGLSPDLLVLQGESPRLREFARAQGMRVASVKMDEGVESILDGIVRIDSLLGGVASSRGRALADSLRGRLDALSRTRDRPPRCLLVLGRRPDRLAEVFTCGRGTFLHELLERAGARNWAGERAEGYASPSLEALVADPPDVVIEVAAAVEGSLGQRQALWRGAGLETVVVRQLDGDQVMIPGPRIDRTLAQLVRLLDELESGGRGREGR